MAKPIILWFYGGLYADFDIRFHDCVDPLPWLNAMLQSNIFVSSGTLHVTESYKHFEQFA